MAYKNIENTRKYSREWMAKSRAANRAEYNKKQNEYKKKRRAELGYNPEYLKLRNDPIKWAKTVEYIKNWQHKNKDRINLRDKKGTIDLNSTRYIKRYLHNIGYPKEGVNPQIIEATKQLLIIKRTK